jgi:hypothetical protein
MLWAILFVLVVLAVGGFALYWLVQGWGLEEIPPPEPMPFITSAVGTGAHTIHLTLYKGSGQTNLQVELERYRPSDQTTSYFFTSLKELDDTDLERDDTLDTLYRYRARYRPQGTAGPWSPPKEARLLPLIDALSGELTLPEGTGWAGYCLVQRFEAGALSRSGEQVSLTLRASPVGLSIDRIYISQADQGVGKDLYDSVEYRAAIQDTVFKPPLIIPSSPPNQTKTVTLPAILYTLDNTKPLLIAVDFSATPASDIMYREVSPAVAVAYYKLQAPLQPGEEPEARKMDRTGYFREPTDPMKGGIYLIEKIEVG